jgi:hypothetical protein
LAGIPISACPSPFSTRGAPRQPFIFSAWACRQQHVYKYGLLPGSTGCHLFLRLPAPCAPLFATRWLHSLLFWRSGEGEEEKKIPRRRRTENNGWNSTQLLHLQNSTRSCAGRTSLHGGKNSTVNHRQLGRSQGLARTARCYRVSEVLAMLLTHAYTQPPAVHIWRRWLLQLLLGVIASRALLSFTKWHGHCCCCCC